MCLSRVHVKPVYAFFECDLAHFEGNLNQEFDHAKLKHTYTIIKFTRIMFS